MKANKLVKGDYRKREDFIPTKHFSQADYVIENKSGPTRSDKRRSAHYAGRKNTRGFAWGYNQQSWMEYCEGNK